MFMKRMKLICKAQGKGQAKGVLALTRRAGDTTARMTNRGCSSCTPSPSGTEIQRPQLETTHPLSRFSGPRVYTMPARSLTLGACNPL